MAMSSDISEFLFPLFILPSFPQIFAVLFCFYQEEVGGRGGVDDLYLGYAELEAGEGGEVFLDHLALCVALGMSGVDCDGEHSVRVEKRDRGLDRGHSGLAHCGYRLIAAGKPTEVEHSALDLAVNVLRGVVM